MVTKTKDKLKVLLLQIREDAKVRIEEHESFARYSGLDVAQIAVHNVFDKPKFGPETIDGYDALFVGGASEASVLEPQRYPFVGDAQTLLLHCIQQDFPVFASCFGFQLAVLALGGEIIRDSEDFEMGTIAISLAEAAKQDPVFQGTSNGFMAVAVHQEKAITAPPGCTELAFTRHCNHAFKVDNARFWAFQFHPEVDLQILVERLTIYRDHYTRDTAHLDEVLSQAVEVPESTALLKKFVARVLLVNGN